MRLGQLARQLDIKTDKIVNYLASEEGIVLNAHPNAKIDDSLIEKIEKHFKPTTEVIKKSIITEASKNKIAKVKKEVNIKVERAKDSKESGTIETIKPAVQKLKIIGKIDLPDTSKVEIEVDGVVYDQATLDNKKKEELAIEREKKAQEEEEKRKEEEEKKRIALEKRKAEEERQAMLAREEHNILSVVEEKKKAIIIKAQQERERKLEEKRRQLQKEHYLKNVLEKNTPSVKKKRTPKVQTKVVDQQKNKEVIPPEKEPQVQLSIFQKFIKWLNT